MWFDNWAKMLVDNKFARPYDPSIDINHNVEKDGELVFFPGQKRRIINLDETAISLDGFDGQRGGRPSVSFVHKQHNNPGKATNKAGKAITMIGGCNAEGTSQKRLLLFPKG